jgi:uncharacterized protein (UPF0332 family)
MTSQRDSEDYLAKAFESLASAESDLTAGRYNSCMNRSYFACFQAAVSALVRSSLISAHAEHDHYFIQAQFALLINRRKLYPANLGRVLPTLMSKRHLADYRPMMASSSDARRAASQARQFVAAVNAGANI